MHANQCPSTELESSWIASAEVLMYSGKNLVCHECKKLFLFSEEEQAFFKQKGFTNLPKRCANCRLTARLRRNGDNLEKLHDTNCHKCGAVATVPFEPNGLRPVYCRACYMDVRAETEAEAESTSVIA